MPVFVVKVYPQWGHVIFLCGLNVSEPEAVISLPHFGHVTLLTYLRRFFPVIRE